MPEAFVAWGVFGLLPVVFPAVLAIFMKARSSAKVRFALSSASRLLEWPVLFGVVLCPLWFAFEMVLAPAVLDAYPFSRVVVAGPLALNHWIFEQGYWLVPLAWLALVLFGSLRLRKTWQVEQNAGTS